MGILVKNILLVVCLLGTDVLFAQTWQRMPIAPVNAQSMWLMRDGTVLVNEAGSNRIAILTPDQSGSYLAGTWSMGTPLPAVYAPTAFGSAVLPDGRLIFEGGEINWGEQDETTLGAIYDPKTKAWTLVDPPAGWKTIGDAPSVVLPNGKYMQGNCCDHTLQMAILDPKTMQWTEGPNSNTVNLNEQGWTLLRDGRVLAVDLEYACNSYSSTQYFDGNKWACGPNLPVQLWMDRNGNPELGSTVLAYNGEIVQFSGSYAYGTAFFNPLFPSWHVGPTPPAGYTQDDGPSVLEPNGLILAMLGTQNFNAPICHFFEYNPYNNTLAYAPNPPECPYQDHGGGASRMLILPTGQILFADASHILEMYTPAPGVITAAAPIMIPPNNPLYVGSNNNSLTGMQLNSVSQGCFYGDDYQCAENYPLVELVDGGGHVWFAPTHDDSYSGIAPGYISSTLFDIPMSMPAGPYTMQVVTNGIASNAAPVTIQPANQ